MDDPSGSKSSDLSFQVLMDEHSSQPSQAPWIWCIEYVAKFKKDLHCILDMMNMGLQCPVDLGKRTNEVVALRILEFMFNTSKKHSDGISVTSASGPMIEFDSSLSSIDVLKAILKEIPLAGLRPGMTELSKFNVLPFIAHKNSCLPKCALEMLRDVILEEDQNNAASSIQATEPVHIDGQSMHMDEQPTQAGEEAMKIDRETMNTKDVENQRNAASHVEPRQIVEKPIHMGDEAVHINEQANVIIIDDDDDDDEPMHINEHVNVTIINGDGEAAQEVASELINNENSDSSCGKRREDVRVRCMEDGTWLICGNNKDVSTTNQDILCVKCGKDGILLVCNSRDCSVKVHQECLKGQLWLDENENFHCPQCQYHQVTLQYLESKNSLQTAKKKMMKFHTKVSSINKRRKGIMASSSKSLF